MPKKVTVVVMAFNEEGYILNVLQPLKEWKMRDATNRDIVIVDDGSTDRTAMIAKSEGFTVLKSDPQKGSNLGKGKAFMVGANFANENGSKVMVMLDADIFDINPEKIDLLVGQLVNSKHKMVIAQCNPQHHDPESYEFVPILASGQRAIKMEALIPLFKGSPKWTRMLHGYGLEKALNHLIPGFGIAQVTFNAAPAFRRDNLKSLMLDIMGTEKIIRRRNALSRELNELRKAGKKAEAREKLIEMQKKRPYLR
jgi:glycosyltransferase involved in cell wall biosynthesis